MKYVKISILLIVLSIIAYQVYQQIPDGPIENIKPGISSDHITDAVITSEINKFNTIDNVKQCIQHYDNIFYSINHTNFDNDAANNKSTIENLNKNLYAAYAPRFLVLSKSYLGNHDWSNENIGFIQIAGSKILRSPLLDANSSLRSQYVPLMNAIQLRNKIVGFLNSVTGISTACSSIDVDFPDYTEMVVTSSSHIATLNGNGLMKKCEALKVRLRNVRDEICNKHVTYLDNMIRRSSHRYFPTYVNLNAYSDNVRDVITQKINRLGELSTLYGKSRRDIGLFQSKLNSKLDKVYIDADDYFTAIDNDETHNCKYPN